MIFLFQIFIIRFQSVIECIVRCMRNDAWHGFKQWEELRYDLWRHDMETLSTLIALCDGISPVHGGCPSQKASNMESFRSLNNLLNKQSNMIRNDIMWRHYNDHHDHVYYISQRQRTGKYGFIIPSPVATVPRVSCDLGRSCHYIKTTLWFVSKFGSISRGINFF